MQGRKRTLLIAAVVGALAVPPLLIVVGLDRDDTAETTSDAATVSGESPKPQAAVKALIPLSKAPPIVFSRQRQGRYQLYGTSPDGGEAVRLSDRPAGFASWSPDGRQLVFVTEALGFSSTRRALAVIDASGEIRDVLSGPQVPSHPSFDQRRQRVVYQSTLETQSGAAGTGGLTSIDEVPTAEGQQRTLLDERGATYQPAVAPDGRLLAAVIGEAGCREELCPQRLVLYEPDGTNPQTLVDEGAAAAPSWSPDGQRIAFTWDQGDGPGVWIIDVASRSLIQVTSGSPPDAEPTWSPDGQALAFSRACDIFVASVGGGAPRNITSSRPCEISPTWRPR